MSTLHITPAEQPVDDKNDYEDDLAQKGLVEEDEGGQVSNEVL